jgi:hypothetical protein
MCNKCNYTIHAAQHHFGWDNSIAPAQRAEPGATILFRCRDSSAGQLGPESTVADVVALDFGRINPVSGPVYVEGAEPGDALKITIDSFVPQTKGGAGFGWTANIPGLRAARRSVHRSRAACLEIRSGYHGAGHVRQGRPRAAQAICRNHRQCASRAGLAFGRAAAPGGRKPGYPRPGRWHHALSAGRGGGRAVQCRRHPRRAGRRRGLRHGDREPDGCGSDHRSGQERADEVSRASPRPARSPRIWTPRATRSPPGSART